MPQPPATIHVGLPFIELASVDSTNNYARSRIQEGLAQPGMAIFAHEQIAGKGQRGKSWLSSPGENIALSVILQPAPLLIRQQFQLSACAAVGLCDFFTEFAGEDTRIKWPNDLYWQDRKAGGILIENTVSSGSSSSPVWEWSIIGIGVNVNQVAFPLELINPVSLKQITGKTFDPLLLAKTLCTKLQRQLTILHKDGFEPIYQQYVAALYKKDSMVRLKKNNRAFEARIQTVTQDGKLVVQHSVEEEFEFGDIEWLMQ